VKLWIVVPNDMGGVGRTTLATDPPILPCVACRYCETEGAGYYCNHPALQPPPTIDPVTGTSESTRRTCHSARAIASQCGPEGSLWEPMDSTPAGFI
jgi:hypothetical protein